MDTGSIVWQGDRDAAAAAGGDSGGGDGVGVGGGGVGGGGRQVFVSETRVEQRHQRTVPEVTSCNCNSYSVDAVRVTTCKSCLLGKLVISTAHTHTHLTALCP